ncbi:unnamed protein product [Trichobilharzia szidati]|nr:unnamed protein product [Trichobilharzia szidati]
MILFFIFRNKFSVASFIMALIILLCTTNIYLACCSRLDLWCYLLIGFCALEDLLTIVLCSLTKRFKRQVIISMLVLAVVFCITGTVFYYLYKYHVHPAWAGGFWNTASCLAALAVRDLLK